jgi:hypothetical protein
LVAEKELKMIGRKIFVLCILVRVFNRTNPDLRKNSESGENSGSGSR